MGRWLATALIAALLLLDLLLPGTSLGRRGNDAETRRDSEQAFASVGIPLPAIDLYDLEGGRLSLEDFRGKRVLLTFERSVDW